MNENEQQSFQYVKFLFTQYAFLVEAYPTK